MALHRNWFRGLSRGNAPATWPANLLLGLSVRDADCSEMDDVCYYFGCLSSVDQDMVQTCRGVCEWHFLNSVVSYCHSSDLVLSVSGGFAFIFIPSCTMVGFFYPICLPYLIFI